MPDPIIDSVLSPEQISAIVRKKALAGGGVTPPSSQSAPDSATQSPDATEGMLNALGLMGSTPPTPGPTTRSRS